MQIFEKIQPIESTISELKNKSFSIGFVPTMGALHEGHLALIKKSTQENDKTVVSIFVNPTQFNNKDDFENYPQCLNEDIKKLEQIKCNYLFVPSADEIYTNKNDNITFDLEHLDKIMEGKFRKGHFNGVAQIVKILFEIIKPDKAYFGLKDYQQIAVIKLMLNKYMPKNNIKIISLPIVRESDGLAMSSRNTRLNKNQRQNAPLIYQTISKIPKWAKNNFSLQNIYDNIKNTINKNPELQLEYIQIVKANNLLEIKNLEPNIKYVACIAVFAGQIKLIDNIEFCI